MNLKRIGLDRSKAVFTLHGVDQHAKAVLRVHVAEFGMMATREACRGSKGAAAAA